MSKDESKFELDIERFKEAVSNRSDQENEDYLNLVLKHLFDPNKSICSYDDDSDIVKCITGGLPIEKFIKTLEENDSTKLCGKILNETDFGFSCKTCELVQGMFLCIDCFKNGNHLDHEYVLKLSSNGASCDCGDASLMREKEFCKIHACPDDREENPVTKELLKYAEIILPNLLYRLLQILRQEEIISKYDRPMETVEDIEKFYECVYLPIDRYVRLNVSNHLNLLVQLSKAGYAVRKMIAHYLTDTEYYKKQIEIEQPSARFLFSETGAVKKYSFTRIKEKCDKLKPSILYPEKFAGLKLIDFECNHMLDEFMFWWLYLKTPNSIATLLLNTLFTGEKEEYAKSFLKKYCLVDFAGISLDPNFKNATPLFSHFFDDGNISEKLSKQSYLLETFLLELYNIFSTSKLLINDVIESDEENKHLVVDCNHVLVQSKIINNAIYRLHDILIHSKVAKEFISKEDVFSIWMDLVSHLQGVFLNIRKLDDEDFYENESYEKTFTLEQLVSGTIWALLNSKNESSKDMILKVLNIVNSKLLNWIESIGMKASKPNSNHLTFHLPIHRYYSAFLYNALFKHQVILEDVLTTDENTLLNILAHPLQLQVGIHEIQSNLWVKNGEMMKAQVQYYTHPTFCKLLVDGDLFLIQCVANNLSPDVFVQTVFDRFRIFDICRDIITKKNEVDIENRQKVAMVNGALIFLAQVIYRDISLEVHDHSSIRNEILNVLSYEDESFSKIESKLPYTWEMNISKAEMKEIVNEIGDLIQPEYTSSKTLKNAKYVLKEKHWEESYDPLFYMFYRSHNDESDVPFERYSKYVKTKNLCKDTSKLVPPFRLPSKRSMEENKLKGKYNLANSRTLHSVLLILLHQRLNSDNIDDKVFYLVLYLIELGINVSEIKERSDENRNIEERYLLSDFGSWFQSDDIIDNMCITIPHVQSNEDLFEEKIVIGIDESIISLLLKILYKTKTRDDKGVEKQAKFKFRSELSESRIGDECTFLNNILNKAANLSSKCKEKIMGVLRDLDKDNSASDDNEDEARQRHLKAQERQKKLLENMSKIQKKFIENVNEEFFKRQVSQMSSDDYLEDNPNAYDCCICRTSSTPSYDSPIGLVSLVNPSSVVGLCDSNYRPKTLESLRTTKTTLWYKEQKRAEFLKEIFTTESCKQSVNIGYKGGVYLITCGHHMHFSCYSQFIIEKEGKIFNCPLCTQEGNILIPIRNKDTPMCKVVKMRNSTEEDFSSDDFIVASLKSDTVVHSNYLKHLMFCDMITLEGICKLIPSQYQFFNTESKPTRYFNLLNESDATLLTTSLLRIQLEVNCLQNKTSKWSRLTKACIIPYFELLSTRCRQLCAQEKPQLKAWTLLTKPDLFELQEKEVPVLLRDPVSMFLLIILNWPTQIHRATYERIANTVFNLVYLQNTIAAVLQLKSKEREEYSLKYKNQLKTADDYLSYVASQLQNLHIESVSSSNDESSLNNSQNIYKMYIQELCLPYLKIASLLQCYLFDDEPEETLFDSLIARLKISFGKDTSDNLLQWYDTNPNDILKTWIDQLLVVYSSNKTQVQNLLLLGKSIYLSPKFIELPNLFTDLVFSYEKKRKEWRKANGSYDPAVCLLCGTLVEYSQHACLNHMKECYVDSGIYLSVFTTCVVVYVGEVCTLWGSLYIDAHGEEDLNLQHGGRLFLSSERYEILKQLWFNHSIKHQSLDWA